MGWSIDGLDFECDIWFAFFLLAARPIEFSVAIGMPLADLSIYLPTYPLSTGICVYSLVPFHARMLKDFFTCREQHALQLPNILSLIHG